jgi:hypothetical protein
VDSCGERSWQAEKDAVVRREELPVRLSWKRDGQSHESKLLDEGARQLRRRQRQVRVERYTPGSRRMREEVNAEGLGWARTQASGLGRVDTEGVV